MNLQAHHFDGFTELILSWTLNASGGTAIVDASWFERGRDKNQVFEMDFPDSRIKEVWDGLSGLKTLYDGHMDDTPVFSLSVTDGVTERSVKVVLGLNWSPEDDRGVKTFLNVWHPLALEVRSRLELPTRRTKRK